MYCKLPSALALLTTLDLLLNFFYLKLKEALLLFDLNQAQEIIYNNWNLGNVDMNVYVYIRISKFL